MYPYPMLMPSKRLYPYGPYISPKTQGCDCGEHINKRSTTTERNHQTDSKRNDNEKFLEIQKIDREIQTMSRPRYLTTDIYLAGTIKAQKRH